MKEAEAAEKAAKQEAPRRNRNDKKQIQLRNTNTAMGKALMAAFGNATVTEEAPVAKGGKNADNGAKAANNGAVAEGAVATKSAGSGLSSLSRMVPDKKKLADELGIGEITLTDIIKELEKPGRDPRDEMPKPILRTDVLEMKDLKEGMLLKGTVRNVIDFGVFVDIGVHQDGLVHISQITNKRFIKHPLDAVSVGDIVDVKVMSVDLQKKRIQLTMIL